MRHYRILSFFIVVVAIGCGSAKPTGTLKGQVNHKGQPLAEGEVTLRSSSGVGVTVPIQGGQFAVAQPLQAGDYAVAVAPPVPVAGDPTKGAAPKIVSRLPAKSRDLATSGLSVTVKEGDNDVTIDVKD